MYSDEIWRIAVEPPVRKALKRLPKYDHVRIIEAMDALVHGPYAGDLQKLD